MRRATIAVISCVLLASCGGREQTEAANSWPLDAARSITLPEPVSAVPAYVIKPAHPLRDGSLRRVRDAPGVAVAASIGLKEVRVEGPAGVRQLTVGTVEPLAFRSLTAPSTRDAAFVWTSLMDGEAVVSFDAAGDLGLGESGSISMPDAPAIEVGAFADTGSPRIADVLLADHMGEDLGGFTETVIVVGARTGVKLEALRDDLHRLLPGARLQKLDPPTPSGPRAPEAIGTTGGVSGTMHFRIRKNGFIVPDPAWIEANIATGTVPILGSVTCHRIMFPQLNAALAEVEAAGLSAAIDSAQYGGCYVPRFIDRDPTKALSMHAFGLAIDLNVATNQLGTSGDIDPRVVEIFERWGFEWGGRWARPDPMHFELDRLIQP